MVRYEEEVYEKYHQEEGEHQPKHEGLHGFEERKNYHYEKVADDYYHHNLQQRQVPKLNGVRSHFSDQQYASYNTY